MKRIKVNTTWEEDEEERRKFFAALSFSERLRYYFELRDMTNFYQVELPKKRIFRVYHSFAEANNASK